MAVDFLFTKDLVEKSLESQEGKIDSLSNKYNLDRRGTLRSQLQKVETKEKKLFKLLNLTGDSKDNIDTLKRRIQECDKAHQNLSYFLGSNLYNNFVAGPMIKVLSRKNKIQKEFIQYMGEALEAYDIKDSEELTQAIIGILNSELVKTAYAGATGIKNPGTVKVTTKLQSRHIEDINKALVSDFSEVSKIRINQFVQICRKKGVDIFKENVKVSDNKIEASLELEEGEEKEKSKNNEDWYDITFNSATGKPYTSSEVKKLGGNAAYEMRSRISKLLKSKAGGDQALEETIDYIIFKKEANIFFGDNIANGIIGLIGEILGLFYTRTILGDSNEKITVDWVGGLFASESGQPHADLILSKAGEKKGYGIQVKNTIDDITSGIMEGVHFAQGSTENFFSYLKVNKADQEAVERTYSLYAFNQEYNVAKQEKKKKNKKGGKSKAVYKKSANEAFHEDRKRIEELKNQFDYILSIFAADLMYIATEQTINKDFLSEGNLVFFLGGNNIKMASEILTGLIEEINELTIETAKAGSTSFYISATYDGNPSNIVDYFNEKGRKDKEVKTAAIGKLILTSSYNFTL